MSHGNWVRVNGFQSDFDAYLLTKRRASEVFGMAAAYREAAKRADWGRGRERPRGAVHGDQRAERVAVQVRVPDGGLAVSDDHEAAMEAAEQAAAERWHRILDAAEEEGRDGE